MNRAPMSRKRSRRLIASGEVLRLARVTVWTRDQGRCVIGVPGCTIRGWEVHHRMPRGLGGSSREPEIHSPASLLTTCRWCHAWLESHRTDAQEAGWIVRRGIAKVADVPVRYRGVLCLLIGAGGIVDVTESEAS